MTEQTPVFRVMLRFDINPGMEADFEKTWLSIGNVVTGHPANIGQWLMKDNAEESTYFVVSDWVDEPKFREFEHSAAHLEHRQKLHPFRHGGAMWTMQVVYALTGAGARAGEPVAVGAAKDQG